MKINIFNNYGEIKVDIEKICNDLEKIFYNKFNTNEETSLILVDKIEINRLNKEYRHIDKITDVISFEDHDDNYLGDIFICYERAEEQANLYQHSLEREFAFLICHGLLHLHGYDHLNEEQEKEMFELQDIILDETEYKR